MKVESYERRLKIESGKSKVNLFTTAGSLLLIGYERIVFGGRGPYIEFDKEHISSEIDIIIPCEQSYRVASTQVFYIEYRTNDAAAVKIYHQKKRVDYADYLPGKFYVSPFEMMIQVGDALMPAIERLSKHDQLDLFK